MLQLNGRVIKTDSIQTKKSVGGFESCSCSHVQCSLTTSHEICQARKEKKKKEKDEQKYFGIKETVSKQGFAPHEIIHH